MQGISWSTALILVAALLLVPSVWAVGLPVTQVSHPAGCHQHGPVPSSPSPPSHQCCGSGHQWAIAGTNFSPDRPAAISLRAEFDVMLCRELTKAPVSQFALERASLSESAPLRI